MKSSYNHNIDLILKGIQLSFIVFLNFLTHLMLSLFLFIGCSDSNSPVLKDTGPKDHQSLAFRQGADPGPFIGGGGGEVMVCFGSEAQRAASFSQNGAILPHARHQIEQIYSYDNFESQGMSSFPAFPEDNESSIDFLFRHLESIYKIAPYFAFKLGTSLNHILDNKKDFSSWQDVGSVKDLGDAGIRRLFPGDKTFERLNLFCRPFQIIQRIENYDENNNILNVEIKYDADLFERLKWMNESDYPGILHRKNAGSYHQAVLILHEALYLMTSSLGATDSLSAREILPQVLFDFNAFESFTNPNDGEMTFTKKRHWYHYLVKMLKTFGLKDYPRAFLTRPYQESQVLTLVDFSNHYAQLNDHLNQWILRDIDLTQPNQLISNFVTYEAYKEDEAGYLLERISDIESFLYASEMIWKTEPRDYFHFEYLFLLKEVDEQETMQKYFCIQIKRYLSIFAEGNNVPNLENIFSNANRFCKN